MAMQRVCAVLAVLMAATIPGSGSAADGVLEINQACAVGDGCFAGDAAGFPVSLPGPGSYRLTSDLQVSGAFAAIDAANNGTTVIDLNGFSIHGENTCNGFPPSCSGDTKNGITSSGSVTVRNGTVEGMGNFGLSLGNGSRVDGVAVRDVKGTAIEVGLRSRVTDCVVERIGGKGIVAGTASEVSNNRVVSLGGVAVTLGAGGFALENYIEQCVGTGISGGAGVRIDGNLSYLCTGDGINVGIGSILTDNLSGDNSGDGIEMGDESLARGNVSIGNSGTGFRFGGSASGYRENLIGSNGSLTQGTAVNLGGNLCNGSICP